MQRTGQEKKHSRHEVALMATYIHLAHRAVSDKKIPTRSRQNRGNYGGKAFSSPINNKNNSGEEIGATSSRRSPFRRVAAPGSPAAPILERRSSVKDSRKNNAHTCVL